MNRQKYGSAFYSFNGIQLYDRQFRMLKVIDLEVLVGPPHPTGLVDL